MDKAATKFVTEEEAQKDSPNVKVDHVAMLAEGDPEAAAMFSRRNETTQPKDEQARPLPANQHDEMTANKWASSMFLHGMPEATLSESEKNLLNGLY